MLQFSLKLFLPVLLMLLLRTRLSTTVVSAFQPQPRLPCITHHRHHSNPSNEVCNSIWNGQTATIKTSLAASTGDDNNNEREGGAGLFGQKKKRTAKGFGKVPAAASTNNKGTTAVTTTTTNNNNKADPTMNTIEKKILEIPAANVKVGPLRFYLQLFLYSGDISNTPVEKAWLIQQGQDFTATTGTGDNNDDDVEEQQAGELQVFYHDGTAMMSIQFTPNAVVVVRKGQKPSMAYQLQESIFLHSVLDELSNVASGKVEGSDSDDTVVEPSKRLLLLASDDDIENARANLPARKAS